MATVSRHFQSECLSRLRLLQTRSAEALGRSLRTHHEVNALYEMVSIDRRNDRNHFTLKNSNENCIRDTRILQSWCRENEPLVYSRGLERKRHVDDRSRYSMASFKMQTATRPILYFNLSTPSIPCGGSTTQSHREL